MVEVELQISDRADTDTLVRLVEQICTGNRLTCTLKGTLAKYPGSIHWHFKKDDQKGIVEITWWETAGRLWFKLAGNRRGDWIEDSIPVLKEQIEKLLG